jgi:hypothetical protein
LARCITSRTGLCYPRFIGLLLESIIALASAQVEMENALALAQQRYIFAFPDYHPHCDSVMHVCECKPSFGIAASFILFKLKWALVAKDILLETGKIMSAKHGCITSFSRLARFRICNIFKLEFKVMFAINFFSDILLTLYAFVAKLILKLAPSPQKCSYLILSCSLNPF